MSSDIRQDGSEDSRRGSGAVPDASSHDRVTFCRVCEPACGLVARVENGELVRLRPDKENPISRGFACNKGLAGDEIHRDPDRLDHPLRRRPDGGFDLN